METAEDTDVPPSRQKLVPGRLPPSPAAACVALVVALAACAGTSAPAPPDRAPPAAAERAGPATAPSVRVVPAAVAAEILRSDVAASAAAAAAAAAHGAERAAWVRALGRHGGDSAAEAAARYLADPTPEVCEEAAFAVGVSGSDRAAALLRRALLEAPVAAPAHVVAAAALGLADCSDDAAGDLLLDLARLPGAPEETLEAFFCHVRWRGRPWTGRPDAALLAWERHATPRGRACVGTLGRVSKDASLVDPLTRLSRDADAEVRRAAALGLADGRNATVRAPAEADRAFRAVAALAADTDPRVVAAACRAVASYDRDEAVLWLAERLGHADFNVRVAAAEGIGLRASRGAPAVARLRTAARDDASPSARYAAALALAAVDPAEGLAVADALLASGEAYVRQAGVEVLAKSPDDATPAPAAGAAVTDRLAALAASDPHVRVREAALGALAGRSGPSVDRCIADALAGSDPVLVSVAADAAAKDGRALHLPAIRGVFGRFPGTPGADAREGAVAALAAFGQPDDLAVVAGVAAADPDPGVRLAAASALAERAGAPPPPADADRRGAAAPRVPGGAPLLSRDVVLVLETSAGVLRIRLDAAAAPIHASHVAHLARQGFYDGLTWHRVVPDFVIQGGCPRGDGAGNAGVTLPLEPTRIPFERGTLGMPRSNHPDTGGCQLFVCHSRAPHLDVKYTAFGRVVEGIDVVDRIDVGAVIVRARVEEAR